MTDTARALRAAVDADPWDDTLPLILADAIQDAGDEKLAELWRSGFPSACIRMQRSFVVSTEALAGAFKTVALSLAPLAEAMQRLIIEHPELVGHQE